MIGTFQKSTDDAADGMGEESVAAFGGHRTIDHHSSIQEGRQLGPRDQQFVVHVDHHAKHHDRRHLPVQTHTPLESRLLLRLAALWTRSIADQERPDGYAP